MKIAKLIDALKYIQNDILKCGSFPAIIIGDFNVNLLENSSEKQCLVKYLCEQQHYVQLINQETTDYKTQIDHIYTNIPDRIHTSGVLESYFSDHKPIFVSLL